MDPKSPTVGSIYCGTGKPIEAKTVKHICKVTLYPLSMISPFERFKSAFYGSLSPPVFCLNG